MNDFVFRFLSSFAVVIASQAVSAENQTKNVVLILADDLGWLIRRCMEKPHSGTQHRTSLHVYDILNAYASPIFPNACQHHDRAESGSAWDDRTCRTANEQFEATVGERVARSKMYERQERDVLIQTFPCLGSSTHGICNGTFWKMASWPRAPLPA